MELTQDEKKVLKHLVEVELEEVKRDEKIVRMPVGMFAAEEEFRRILTDLKNKL